MSVWAVGALLRRTGLGGKAELLLLVYGLETVLTTGTCMWEAWLWDEKLINLSEKMVLLGGLYGAYLAIGTSKSQQGPACHLVPRAWW